MKSVWQLYRIFRRNTIILSYHRELSFHGFAYMQKDPGCGNENHPQPGSCFLFVYRLKGLLQIPDNIIDMLRSDGKPDRCRINSLLCKLLII